MIYVLIFYLFTTVFLICLVIDFYNKNKLLFNKIFKYEQIINKQGMNNHEYNNQLMVLSGFLQCKNYKKVKDYLNTIIKDHQNGEDYEVKQLYRLPNGGLKNLLYYKVGKMEKLGIDYFLDITDSFIDKIEKLSVENYSDMTKIFGVLIDNSIDESKKHNSEIEVDFRLKDKCLLIIIKNLVKDFDINKIKEVKYTTKGFGHGYGLQIVSRIVKKNECIDVSYDMDKDQFIQTILIDIQ